MCGLRLTSYDWGISCQADQVTEHHKPMASNRKFSVESAWWRSTSRHACWYQMQSTSCRMTVPRPHRRGVSWRARLVHRHLDSSTEELNTQSETSPPAATWRRERRPGSGTSRLPHRYSRLGRSSAESSAPRSLEADAGGEVGGGLASSRRRRRGGGKDTGPRNLLLSPPQLSAGAPVRCVLAQSELTPTTRWRRD